MIETAQSLHTWWDMMAGLKAKYGRSPDIMNKPEWRLLQDAQNELLAKLHKVTGAPTERLLQIINEAMFKVLGEDAEVVLTSDQAQEIVQVAVKVTLEYDVHHMRARTLMN